MPRLAANLTMMFTEVPFLERFKAAAEVGFGAVEFLFPYDVPLEDIAVQLAGTGLAVALFNMPPGDWAAGERGLAALPHRRDAFRASVDTALRYARVLETPLMHMMAGIADPADTEAMGAYRDALAYAADRAGEDGVGLVIEPLNGRDMPGYFLNDFDRALEIIDRLGHPNVRLQFDIYHRQILHGDVLTALERMMPQIGHVQIASVPGRNEPGSGELNDLVVLRALDDLGYRGHVGCEYRPANGTVAGLGWMKALSDRVAPAVRE